MANARNGFGIAMWAGVLGFSLTSDLGREMRVKESSWPLAYLFYLPIVYHSHPILGVIQKQKNI